MNERARESSNVGSRSGHITTCNTVVLISGRGSNLQAIIDAVRVQSLPITLAGVISNNPAALGLARAGAADIPTQVVDHRKFSQRDEFDTALMQGIDRYRPDLVVLAGFMRLLGARFIDHYAGRLLNIHPSLLPRFPGLDTHRRALQSGATFHGASVHFVTPETDAGPVIIQSAIAVRADDNAQTLAARVLAEEHRIYPIAIRWFAEGRLSVRAGRVLLDGTTRPEQGIGTGMD